MSSFDVVASSRRPYIYDPAAGYRNPLALPHFFDCLYFGDNAS
jgi:hypothetical protein